MRFKGFANRVWILTSNLIAWKSRSKTEPRQDFCFEIKQGLKNSFAKIPNPKFETICCEGLRPGWGKLSSHGNAPDPGNLLQDV